MNLTIKYNDLPPAERSIADMYVIGYTKKEIAQKRNRSVTTVNTQIKVLFEKTGVHKDTAFCTWYYLTRYNLAGVIISLFFLIITIASTIESNIMYRPSPARCRVESVRRVRRNEDLDYSL